MEEETQHVHTSSKQDDEVDLLELTSNCDLNSSLLLMVGDNEYLGDPIFDEYDDDSYICLLYTSPSPRDS